MIISFISHYIRKVNVTHAGTIAGLERGRGRERGAERKGREGARLGSQGEKGRGYVGMGWTSLVWRGGFSETEALEGESSFLMK